MARRPISRPTIGLFTTTSGALFGVAGGIANFLVPGGNPVVLSMSAAGLACIPIGLAVCYGNRLVDWLARKSARHIEISSARLDDIEEVHALAVRQFGEGVTSPEQIKKILSRYREGLKTAHWVGGGKPRELCGYFFVIPINRSLADKIHMDRFKVVEIDVADIPERARYAYATYIGAIVGIGKRARAEILGALKAEMATAAKTKSGLVYAKAATEEGLRVIDGYGFDPVHTKALGLDCYYFRNARRGTAPEKVRESQLTPAFA